MLRCSAGVRLQRIPLCKSRMAWGYAAIGIQNTAGTAHVQGGHWQCTSTGAAAKGMHMCRGFISLGKAQLQRNAVRVLQGQKMGGGDIAEKDVPPPSAAEAYSVSSAQV